MDRQSKIALQELLEHKGWEILKGILVPSLKDQLNASLLSAGRRGDGIEAAKFSGQIDILQRIIDLPSIALRK